MPVPFDQFAATLSFDDLPEDVLRILRLSFMDTMGVAAIGSTTEMTARVLPVAGALFGANGAGASQVLMNGAQTSPAGAAMAGAFMLDSVDAHDGTTPAKGHAGSAVFPALIAMTQAEGHAKTGSEFAALLAIAYEVSYRTGLAQHATCADYHTSGAWTAVGVATSGARLLGGSAEVVRHAAGIGEYHGPRSQMMRCIDHPTNLRDGVGWGAPSGVTAAYLAMNGFTGAPALTCESDEAAPFWNDLGDGWRITDHTHYKAYPCCRWAHPAIDGAAHLVKEHGLTHDMIDAIEIRTFHYATRLAGHTPQTPDEFAYSIAFPVAAHVVRGGLGVSELSSDALSDPDILRLSKATHLIDDDEMTRISTDKRWAQVSIVLKDGRRLEDAPRTPRGDADNPLSHDELVAKFHRFADPVLGEARARELRDLSLQFDTLGQNDFARLLSLCTDPVL